MVKYVSEFFPINIKNENFSFLDHYVSPLSITSDHIISYYWNKWDVISQIVNRLVFRHSSREVLSSIIGCKFDQAFYHFQFPESNGCSYMLEKNWHHNNLLTLNFLVSLLHREFLVKLIYLSVCRNYHFNLCLQTNIQTHMTCICICFDK